MYPISAVIITRNEAHNLEKSLPKLTWCDEIVIVDSGSTDNTIKICKQYGCHIYYRKFDGYGPQKRFAVSIARNNWILNVDADEVLSDELIEEIKAEMANPQFSGYSISMRFVFMGGHFKYGHENQKYFLRLFNKRVGNFDNAKVHEKVVLNGSIKKLKNKLSHYSYSSFTQVAQKIETYSSFGADMAYKRGKKKSHFAIVFTFPFNLFKYYILNGNFLNGKHGFYWSVFSAYYHFLKYVKLNEMYRKARFSETVLTKRSENFIAYQSAI